MRVWPVRIAGRRRKGPLHDPSPSVRRPPERQELIGHEEGALVSADRIDAADGSLVISAFERLAADTARPDAPVEKVLEAAAMGVALAVLGLVDRAVDRDRVASHARKALLRAGTLRADLEDEDAADALDLALEQARRGASLLAGRPLEDVAGRCLDPTPLEIARLIRGELDGHASADVALRLHRSGAYARFAALLPARALLEAPRMRLAADSAPVIRDPSLGRSLGATRLGSTALEAYAFEGHVLAIYAEPALPFSLVEIDASLAARTIETAGYLELCLERDPTSLKLTLTDGQATVAWELQMPAR
jgi:hypothetical protein